jgi:hypothetical protein
MSGASWESHFGGSRGASAWDTSGTTLPSPGNAVLHYDGSDITTLYSDDEVTTLIAGADENVIRGWVSKGSDTEALLSGAADTDVVYLASFQNSLGAVRWDVTTAEMNAEAAAITPDPVFTFLLVASQDETGAEDQWQFDVIDGASAYAQGVAMDVGQLDVYIGDGTVVETGHTVADTAVYALVYTYDSESGDYTIESTHGATITGSTSGGTPSLAPLNTGDNLEGHRSGAVGNLGEVVYWDTATDHTQIATYLLNKWNLTLL